MPVAEYPRPAPPFLPWALATGGHKPPTSPYQHVRASAGRGVLPKYAHARAPLTARALCCAQGALLHLTTSLPPLWAFVTGLVAALGLPSSWGAGTHRCGMRPKAD